MEPPDALAGARGASRLLLLTLLLGARPGAEAEVHVSVPPLVEVMRGEPVTLDCTPTGAHDHYVLEWFLMDRSGARHLLASAELQGSELQGTVHDGRARSPPYQLDSQGRLVLAEAQIGDERDYVCVVKAGAAGTAEATARLRVFAKPEPTEVEPNKGTLSVMEDSAQKIATCLSQNGNPAPQITWYRNGQRLEVPMEVNSDGYMVSRTTREASGLQSLTSILYLRLHKADRDASFHCAAHYSQPRGRHGRLDSPTFLLTLHYLDPLELSVGEELSLPLGGSVGVNCSVQGRPTPALRWTKNSAPLGDGPTLSLSSVTFDSAGTYVCEASMSTVPLLSHTGSFKLLVQGSPELRAEETQPKAEGSWQEGDEVKLTCSARGYPEPRLSWSRLGGSPAEPVPGGQGWVSSSLTLKVTSALSVEGVFCEASNPHGNTQHVFHFGAVAPQTAQAGVAVMAVAVSVGLLLLVVGAFYCMRRKGRPGCCRRREKEAPPPGDPELSHSGSERPEQTGLLTGGASGGARGGSGSFGDEVGEGLGTPRRRSPLGSDVALVGTS
ncbi:basal cell adhesion molecule [Orycteropus afer afer]|uniref:Basal cell adhesion molecule n=1 Tax=Orycteropus afer afer TaxID=1230840 RepID=A0A8B6ZZZ7_ORYAF|nr:basal cell adhesion molecule [Orycteropus afer afer]